MRRRQVPDPQVELELVLREPPRPQAVDQDTHSVIRRRRIVDALDMDHGARTLFALDRSAPMARRRRCGLARRSFAARRGLAGRRLAARRRAFHRLLRASTSMSSATLRRWSALLPEEIACSMQVAA